MSKLLLVMIWEKLGGSGRSWEKLGGGRAFANSFWGAFAKRPYKVIDYLGNQLMI